MRSLPLRVVIPFLLLAVPTAAAVDVRRAAIGFDRPDFATAPAGDARLFVVEQTGRIRVVTNVAAGTVAATPFLDQGMVLLGWVWIDQMPRHAASATSAQPSTVTTKPAAPA